MMNTTTWATLFVLLVCLLVLDVSYGQQGSSASQVPPFSAADRSMQTMHNAEKIRYRYRGTPEPDDANRMGAMRLAGLRGDRTRIPDMIDALKNPAHPGYTYIALHTLAELGAVEALPVIEGKYLPQSIMLRSPDPDLSNYAQAAKARLLAEAGVHNMPDGKEKAAAKVNRFYTELGMTPSDLNAKDARPNLPGLVSISHQGGSTVTYYAIRELADIVYRGPYRDYAPLLGVTEVDFSREHAFALKVRLAPLSQAERIRTMVDELAHKKVLKSEDVYEEQLLVNEDLPASRVIAAQLREMDKHRDQYTHTGFCALFRVLGGIGDQSQTPLIERYLNDSDKWVSYYAKQVHRGVRNGTKFQYIWGY